MDSKYYKEEVEVLRLDELCCHFQMFLLVNQKVFTVVLALIKMYLLEGTAPSGTQNHQQVGDELSKKCILRMEIYLFA